VKGEEAPGAKGSIAALQAAASQSVAGANNSSNDAARAERLLWKQTQEMLYDR